MSLSIDYVINEIQGLVTEKEGLVLYNLARQCESYNYIIEIGSHRGKSTCCLGLGSLHGNNSKVIAIDLWDNPKFENTKVKFAKPKVFKDFIDNITKVGVYPMIVDYMKNDSVEASKTWKETNIGMLFIDGNHSYEGVSNDYYAWSSYVTDNGFILFHDYSKGFKDVIKFVDKLQNEQQIECMSLEDSLMICRKRIK